METFIIVIGIYVIVFSIAGYFLQKNVRQLNYKQDSVYINAYVSKAKPNPENFIYLIDEFEKLANNNFDKQKTADLWELFKDKYFDYLPCHKMQDLFMTFRTLDTKIK
jgi:hypothetical protein